MTVPGWWSTNLISFFVTIALCGNFYNYIEIFSKSKAAGNRGEIKYNVFHVDSQSSAGGVGSKLVPFSSFPQCRHFLYFLESWSHFANEKLEHWNYFFQIISCVICSWLSCPLCAFEKRHFELKSGWVSLHFLCVSLIFFCTCNYSFLMAKKKASY